MPKTADSSAKITAIVPWFGGKRTMAPAIVTELGRHGQYFEPFCGSMAVLFAKEPSQKETVNDLHGDLINLARVLANEFAASTLYEMLQHAVVCEALLDDAQRYLEETAVPGDPTNGELACVAVRAANIMRAYWYFLASWIGRNGTAGTERVDYQLAVRWTKGGGSPTVRWRHAVESIPWFHRRLQNVVILRRDAFKFVGKFEDVKETAIYVDPPYHGTSRSGDLKNGRGGKYLHEFEHDNPLYGDDHVRLRDILAVYMRARVVVSYYDCQRIRELYAGWTFVDHTRQKHLHAQNGRGARPKEAPEVLIINGPSYAREAA